jgi:hypothetical protein
MTNYHKKKGVKTTTNFFFFFALWRLEIQDQCIGKDMTLFLVFGVASNHWLVGA